jgi:nitrous oxidase accessory protein NosD
MQDTKLDGDLTCPSSGPFTALVIVAAGVTLDLGGFTIAGSGVDFGVFVTDELEGVTIKNGTILGFSIGVWAQGHRNLELSKLIFKNNQDNSAAITNGQDIKIRNSSFLSSTTSSCAAGNHALNLRNVANVTVSNVDVHGGFIGVDISCNVCDGSEVPTNGKITDSTFSETHLGVIIVNTSDLIISDNHFSNIVPTATCEDGAAIISVPTSGAPRTGMMIKDNFIHDNHDGITLFGVVAGAEIKGNQVRDNTFTGINLVQSDGIPSTGNLIKDNLTSGNGVWDLFHGGSSTSNTWIGNSCETRLGSDIPDC